MWNKKILECGLILAIMLFFIMIGSLFFKTTDKVLAISPPSSTSMWYETKEFDVYLNGPTSQPILHNCTLKPVNYNIFEVNCKNDKYYIPTISILKIKEK